MSETSTTDLESKIKALDDWQRLMFCAQQFGHAWVNVFVETLGGIGKPLSIFIGILMLLAPGIIWTLTA